MDIGGRTPEVERFSTVVQLDEGSMHPKIIQLPLIFNEPTASFALPLGAPVDDVVAKSSIVYVLIFLFAASTVPRLQL